MNMQNDYNFQILCSEVSIIHHRRNRLEVNPCLDERNGEQDRYATRSSKIHRKLIFLHFLTGQGVKVQEGSK